MTRVQYVNWLLNQCVGQILEIVGVDTKTLGDLQNVLKGGNFEVHGPNGEIFKSSDLRDKCILVKAERCKQKKRLEQDIVDAINSLDSEYREEIKNIETTRKYNNRSITRREKVCKSDIPGVRSLRILFLRIVYYLLTERLKMDGASAEAFADQLNVSAETMNDLKKYNDVKERCQSGDLKELADELEQELRDAVEMIKTTV